MKRVEAETDRQSQFLNKTEDIFREIEINCLSFVSSSCLFYHLKCQLRPLWIPTNKISITTKQIIIVCSDAWINYTSRSQSWRDHTHTHTHKDLELSIVIGIFCLLVMTQVEEIKINYQKSEEHNRIHGILCRNDSMPELNFSWN